MLSERVDESESTNFTLNMSCRWREEKSIDEAAWRLTELPSSVSAAWVTTTPLPSRMKTTASCSGGAEIDSERWRRYEGIVYFFHLRNESQ